MNKKLQYEISTGIKLPVSKRIYNHYKKLTELENKIVDFLTENTNTPISSLEFRQGIKDLAEQYAAQKAIEAVDRVVLDMSKVVPGHSRGWFEADEHLEAIKAEIKKELGRK